ncbi:MAG: TadE/TadG family type IV pilus assembly protein [Planctomycetota bacterium]
MKKHRNRRGATAVEFALVAPIVFLVVLGLVEWARFEMVRQVTSTATFNGARAGALMGATDVDVETKVNNILDVYFVNNATTTTTFSDSKVTVNVKVPVGPNSFLLTRFFGQATLEREFEIMLEN